MAEEISVGCGSSVVNEPSVKEVNEAAEVINQKEEEKMIKVGKPAPLFSAQAFHEGKFINVHLEDYKGKWVLLCFYPGDFTFV